MFPVVFISSFSFLFFLLLLSLPYLLFLSGVRKESKAAKKEKKARYIYERRSNKELFLRVWTLYDLIVGFVFFFLLSLAPSFSSISLQPFFFLSLSSMSLPRLSFILRRHPSAHLLFKCLTIECSPCLLLYTMSPLKLCFLLDRPVTSSSTRS